VGGIAAVLLLLTLAAARSSKAQGASSTTITGTVLDPSGAVVVNATVAIHNPVSSFERSTTTDSSGNFTLPNVPFNPYHLTVTAAGFARGYHNGHGRGGGRTARDPADLPYRRRPQMV